MNLKKLIILVAYISLTAASSYGTSGFAVFFFGESPTEITGKGSQSCQFNQLREDTRWFWKSYLECSNYNYRGVPTKLFFEFFDKKLVKIYVVSKEIKDYFLIRHPQTGVLLPIGSGTKKSSFSNLADELIFKDKEYQTAVGQKLTHFFFDNSWEWEITFEDPDYNDTNLDNMESQLEDEADKGLKGWKRFEYDTPLEEIKSLLQGQCSKIDLRISPNVVGRKNLICSEYLFIQQRITVAFSFAENKLAQIKLDFPGESYDIFSPLLKKKYGKPYSELGKNRFYYPFIDFPQKGVTLAHDPLNPSRIYLRYQKAGFEDKEELMQIEEKNKVLKKVKSRKEVLLDNL